MLYSLNMAKKIHIHFLGIAGSGASAVAAIAQARGYKVSGCDHHPFNEFTAIFDQTKLREGHNPEHLHDADVVAISPAITWLDQNNPELVEARRRKIPILTWQQFMGKYLEKGKIVIAVCGTHGKSTTTAMIGTLLENAGLDPAVELGAIVPEWQTNYRIGVGKYFVTEADEFNDNFLASHPDITIVTAVEMDHPEYYRDFDAYKKSFVKFLRQNKGLLIVNMQDRGVQEVIEVLKPRQPVIDYSQNLIDFSLSVPGQYNNLNASAVFQTGLALGIKPEVIRKSLQNFSGIGRRFELLGTYQGAKVYSDFAHHPTEIEVTLNAAREKFPNSKITVVFQPHMFSRTHFLFNDFVNVFQQLPVDQIFIQDIYPSREVDTGVVNSRQLVEAIDKDSVIYSPDPEDILKKLQHSADENSVIFFVGAGETHNLAKQLVNENK